MPQDQAEQTQGGHGCHLRPLWACGSGQQCELWGPEFSPRTLAEMMWELQAVKSFPTPGRACPTHLLMSVCVWGVALQPSRKVGRARLRLSNLSKEIGQDRLQDFCAVPQNRVAREVAEKGMPHPLCWHWDVAKRRLKAGKCHPWVPEVRARLGVEDTGPLCPSLSHHSFPHSPFFPLSSSLSVYLSLSQTGLSHSAHRLQVTAPSPDGAHLPLSP